jgi:hypothetical protein
MEVKKGEYGGTHFVCMDENRTTKPVEIVLKREEGDEGE